jgi:putative intracellular protease/amidase
VTTMGGIRIDPDLALAELEPSDSAMLVLPGADTWDQGANGAFAQAARRFLEAGVPVAAICGGTLGLAREGLLDDREHTSSAPDYLATTGYAGAELYREAAAVTDGDLITAGPTDGLEFAAHALARLDVFEPEVLEAWKGLFSDGDPRWFATLAAAEAGAR